MGRWPGQADQEQTTFGGLSRSALMTRIRSTGNVTTELRMATLLRAAHLKGWRRHAILPGKPDFVWAHLKVALFVDGCFWHGHSCKRNLTPKVNAELWQTKIGRNKARDRRVSRALRERGWKVVRVWECQLAKHPERCITRVRRAMESRRKTVQGTKRTAVPSC